MKAFVLKKYGHPLSAVDMPVPEPGPHEVLVRMVASGVNHADERTRTGEFKAVFRLDLPKVMGGELSGEVVAVGSQVAGLAVGDQVYGYTGVVAMGTWAEFVVIDADALAPAPRSISLAQAASLPVVALTAWQSLVTIGRLQPGQTVLVHGGAGGVGSAVIQLAKHLGATVATTASASSAETVRQLGADIIIDYRSEDFVQRLAETPVDIVVDTQGGEITSRSFQVLRPGGIVVGIAGTPDPSLADQAGAEPLVKVALSALSLKVRRQAASLACATASCSSNPTERPCAPSPDSWTTASSSPSSTGSCPSSRPSPRSTSCWPAGPAARSSWPPASRRLPLMPETDGTTMIDGPITRWTSAPTRHLQVRGESFAYRDLGIDAGTPIVLLAHLGATLDEWDPRVVEALAEGRRVIAVDLPGIGSSTGNVPRTIKGMAGAARAFISELGLTRIDLMGFSLGGFVAQQVTLDAPELVRRLVLAGTGPAGGEGIDRPTGAAYVYLDMLRGVLARTDAKEFLFFPRTPDGKAAARDYLARIHERVMDRDSPITLKAFRTQIAAIKAWGRQQPQDLSRITAPTLIANGDHDRMVPTPLSEDMHRRIPGSTLVIYPGAGHGGVFQYYR